MGKRTGIDAYRLQNRGGKGVINVKITERTGAVVAINTPAPDPDAVIEARKRDALTLLALHALPHMAHKALWDTLDVSYFMRHQADEIAWHTRVLSRQLALNARAAAGALPRPMPISTSAWPSPPRRLQRRASGSR